MKVQQLFLRNVRGIKNLDLDFRNPVTGKPLSRVVLAGANGSGKTTILECLFGLLNAAEKYGKGSVDYYSQLSDVRVKLPVDARLQAVFEIGFVGKPTVLLSAVYGPDGAIENVSGVAEMAGVGGRIPSLSKRTEWIRSPSENSLFRQLAASAKQALQREDQPIGSVLYFPDDRHLPSVSQGELGFEARPYQWAYRFQASEEWKGSLESYLFSLNYLDLEDRDRRVKANRFEQAVELVNAVLDGKKVARIEKGRAVVETADGHIHSLDDLSSGEKQLLLLLVDINRRIVPGSVILIDEPEISLHPTWQRGLVAALDRIIEQYDAQVILATHSLENTKMMFPEEVFILTDLDLPVGRWDPEAEVLAR